MALALNVFKTITATAGTASVGIYTAPVGYSGVVLLAQAANITNNTYSVTFSHQRGSVTTELIKNSPIPGNDSLSLITGRLIVQQNDILVLSASDVNSIKVTVSLLETLN
jgi:hypothetical protein